MIKAIVFDMDGLLVDSEPIWHRARIETFGADRLRWTQADQEHVMGSHTETWAAYVAERLEHQYTVPEVIEQVVRQMEVFYRESVPYMPGAREIFGKLDGQFTLGLASGSPYRLIHAVLESAGWTDMFVNVLSTDELPHGKPAPDAYLESARRLNIPVEQIAIFEDSANGILSGRAAGVRVIAVPSSYQRPPADTLAKADQVIESLADFSPDMLKNW
ncbi:MAG: HAD family phosphatase [Anaerolineae bacterium]|nr:HAD family phosphatase [Anaerolineae bacterium]